MRSKPTIARGYFAELAACSQHNRQSPHWSVRLIGICQAIRLRLERRMWDES